MARKRYTAVTIVRKPLAAGIRGEQGRTEGTGRPANARAPRSILFYFISKDMIWHMLTLNRLISPSPGPKSPLTRSDDPVRSARKSR